MSCSRHKSVDQLAQIDFMKRVNDEGTSRETPTPNKKLSRIQNEYRSAIPKLALVKDKVTTNFEEWNSAFLAYLEVLHPDLHSVCKMVFGMDFTAETSSWTTYLSPSDACCSRTQNSWGNLCNQKHLFFDLNGSILLVHAGHMISYPRTPPWSKSFPLTQISTDLLYLPVSGPEIYSIMRTSTSMCLS